MTTAGGSQRNERLAANRCCDCSVTRSRLRPRTGWMSICRPQLISVEKDRVQASDASDPRRCGVVAVIASIDTNGDGVISEAEQPDYAERVLDDLSITVDGDRVKPRLVSVEFPRVEEMKEGLGEIQIEFRADLPSGRPNRRLILENHHQSRIAAYLVNCLVPRDQDIRIVSADSK